MRTLTNAAPALKVENDPTVDSILNYWHGWWRFLWHWHKTNQGTVWPDIKTVLAHRKYCEDSWDKIGIGITVWRISICFSCGSKKKSDSRWRKYFADAEVARQWEAEMERLAWPELVYEDVLDMEILDV